MACARFTTLRFTALRRLTLAALILATLVPLTGCNAVALVMYTLKGNAVPPEFEELKDKRVAVVCRPTTSLQYTNAGVDKQLARELGTLLKLNVKKLELVNPDKVDKWTDENSWEEYVEVGRAVDAEMLVAIELEAFSLYQSQTIYQGKANVIVRVYDMKDDGKLVYEKTLPQTIYPVVGGVPTDKPESQFRREFLARLGGEIGRHFYSHDPGLDFARDTAAYAF